ncbi:hypothetical protein BDW60DRAFT_69762 [Aspergillus nidulans var. acristatus]
MYGWGHALECSCEQGKKKRRRKGTIAIEGSLPCLGLVTQVAAVTWLLGQEDDFVRLRTLRTYLSDTLPHNGSECSYPKAPLTRLDVLDVLWRTLLSNSTIAGLSSFFRSSSLK